MPSLRSLHVTKGALAVVLLPFQGSASGSPAAPPPGGQPSISYRVDAAEDVYERFGARELALLEKLNRMDRDRFSGEDVLVVPDRWDADELEYSPLPASVPELAAHPKGLVVHQPLQVFGAYEEGRLVRWGPVSTGREEHSTPAGRFYLTWRSRGRHSTVEPEWYLEWYFNFHNERGLSFHEYALPGRPASRACVRLLERDARWIYEWGDGWTLDERGWEVVEEGTPVWILGAYDFDRPPPWRSAEAPHPRAEVRIPGAP